MKLSMSYKKIFVLCTAAVVCTLLVFSACSKKKSEEEITITLKTEGSPAAQAATAQAVAAAKPAVPEHSEPVPVRRGKERTARHEKAMKLPAQQVPEKRAAPAGTQVASTAPPAVQQTSPDDIARQQILAIINRQKQAMAAKNVNLALADLAGNHDQNQRTLQDYFNRYDKISVIFSNISINVSGSSAFAVMDQKTSIVTKSVIPQTVTEHTKVQWTFVQENGRWLITGTQILSRVGNN